MTIIWKLRQINVAKQLPHGVAMLPGKNVTLSNILQRLSSNFKQIPQMKITSRMEERFRRIDKLSNNYILIYHSPISRYITYCYHTSYLFIIAGIYGIYYVKKQTNVSYPIFENFSSNDTSKNIVFEGENNALVTLGALIVMNIVLFWICRIHALRIWHNPAQNQYTLHVVGNLPIFKNTLVFEPGAVLQKYKNSQQLIRQMPHTINGKTYHFLSNNFKTPAEYDKLLGRYGFQQID